jgi:uncharacterized protein (DUF433 family)
VEGDAIEGILAHLGSLRAEDMRSAIAFAAAVEEDMPAALVALVGFVMIGPYS